MTTIDSEVNHLEKDSPTIEAMLAAYNTHQLIAVTNRVPGAIAIEALPLARIKRIMKQDSCDPHPRMISADATPLMAYAAQLFIGSITSLAWQLSTSHAKRNTLQVKDLKAVVQASSRFDFLIDIMDIFDLQQAQSSPEPSSPMEHPPHMMSPELQKYLAPPQLAKSQTMPNLLPILCEGEFELEGFPENLNATAPPAVVHPMWATTSRTGPALH